MKHNPTELSEILCLYVNLIIVHFRKNFSSQKQKLSGQMIPYINAARQVVMDTCHLVLVFVTLLVLVDILGSVNWIYLKR